MRQLILVASLIFSTSLALSQSTEKPKEEWKTLLENSTTVHQVEMNSIAKDGPDIFYFVHRAVIKNPRTVNGTKITHMLTLNAINCKARITMLVADIIYADDMVVAKNVVAEKANPLQPEEGTVQHTMMVRLCGHPKNYI